MAESISKLEILVQLRDEASTAIRSMSNSLSDLGGQFGFAGDKVGALSGVLQTIGSGAIIKGAVNAFAEAEVQMARFDTVLKTLPPNLQTLKGQILQVADEALVKFGFDNEEAAVSIARLLQATHDGPFSFQAFSAAMDLARFKGISLEDATQALILAFQGNARLLKQFGIEVDDHASKETILAAIMQTVGGQAQAYSETLKGQLAITKQLGGEGSEALGQLYAPAIEMVTSMIREWVTSQGGINNLLESHKNLLIAVASVLVALFVAGIIVAIAAALTFLGPLGLIIAAIAALGGVIVFFYTLWKTQWENVKSVFFTVWNAIKDFFASLWDGILNVFNAAIQKIKDAISSIVSAYNAAVAVVSAPIKAATGAVKSVVSKFADGGIVTGPTLGLVGEAGPEAIIPLSQLGSAGGGVVINLQGDFYTSTEVAETFGNELARIIKNQINLGGIRA
ncbi:hypothetical protein IPJ70_04305 [Candidatus Campbellbacteria bacterium]|nr:MAG: hypothetical protein IPJ70_04305 [Candidatus Campbellbacteria bacterium]